LLFDRKKLEFSRVISVFIILLPTIILASTQYGLMSFDYTNCDRAANEGPLAIYGYLVELYFVVMIIYTACKALYKKILSYSEIIFFTVGMIGFLIAFSIGNVVEVFTENWFIGQIGLLGVPFFILILVYLITRFKTINVRTVISEFLIAILFIAILSLLFIEDLSTAKYIVYATLAMVAVLGDILIKSIYKSEKQNSELLRLNLRLTELDKQKSEFVSFATHQLRSPITALKGYASLLLEGEYGKLNEQMTEPIKRIYDSSVTLNAVVDDYLNISRIELGTMKYDFIPLSLKDLVDTTVAELKPNIDRSGVSWSYVTCDSPCMINADKERIKQVISNLIDNGLKYSNKTNVKVTLERDDSTRIVRFTVEDGGIGIAPEVLGKLFEKFVRANSANIANIRGTGLGLFVAREIIRVHKGRIFGESLGENKGSKFTVELPLV